MTDPFDAFDRRLLDSLEDGSELKENVQRLFEEYYSGPRALRPGRRQARPPKKLRDNSRIALYLENISVSFDGFQALNRLTMYIDEGELRCVIGPNGAGKTTMMDVMTGKTRPDRGTAWFTQEYNLLDMDEVSIAQAGICRKFQKPSVFEALSVAQNLELACRGDKSVRAALFSRLSGEEAGFLERVLERIHLREQRKTAAGKLSHGQKQWLEIGMLLMQKPRLLLLDEPVAGMSPQEVDRTVELLHDIAGEQSIVLVEHDMEFVRAVARKVTVLHQGMVLAEGSMEEVRNNPDVVTAYLGEAQC
ncbi:MAG: urea ABC transporter ATP-binding protein UrtD [Desulfovibrio sp.]|jgi:urea transport system ATP-binding protein|nr:urea ABC transporter ATP-binding protein UrtD [Desulfovibrio sp.]